MKQGVREEKNSDGEPVMVQAGADGWSVTDIFAAAAAANPGTRPSVVCKTVLIVTLGRFFLYAATVASTQACAPGASCSPHHHIVSVTGLVGNAFLGSTDADAPIKVNVDKSTATAEPAAIALPEIFIKTLHWLKSRTDFGSDLETFPEVKESTC